MSAHKHPDADSLYVERIDLGEAEPRQIVSGLAPHYVLEEFVGHKCLVVVNLKPGDLRGVVSYGMVLCAKSPDCVELVEWPEGSVVGERVTYEGYDVFDIAPDLEVNAKKKTSAWHKAVPDFKTDNHSLPCFGGKALVTSAGRCFLKSPAKLVDAPIA